MYNLLKIYPSILLLDNIAGTKLQHAQWIPNTNKLVYVYDNNIYIKDLEMLGLSEDEKISKSPDFVLQDPILQKIVYGFEINATNDEQITFDGQKDIFAYFFCEVITTNSSGRCL